MLHPLYDPMIKKSDNITLLRLRTKIDKIDLELLSGLNQRALLVAKIKKIKSKSKIKTYDPKREQEILSALCQNNKGPLSDREIQFLFRAIIRFFRLRQKNAKKAAKIRAEK